MRASQGVTGSLILKCLRDHDRESLPYGPRTPEHVSPTDRRNDYAASALDCAGKLSLMPRVATTLERPS